MEIKGKEVRYVGERAINTLVERNVLGAPIELTLGDVLVPATDQSDPHRVLSMSERFWQSVSEIERLGEKEATRYGFSYFDLEELDPFSREVRGPFTHSGIICVDFDTLPGVDSYKAVSVKNSVLKYAYDTHICIDPERVSLDVESISAIVCDTANHILSLVDENDKPIKYIKEPRTLVDEYISIPRHLKVVVKTKQLDDEVMETLTKTFWNNLHFVKGY